jgi:hypothetical protein
MRDLIGFAPFAILMLAAFATAIGLGLGYWTAIAFAIGVELFALFCCSLIERLCDRLFSAD